MDFVNLLQWPAMAITIAATLLVASSDSRHRKTGFWLFLASNGLWIAWGVHAYTPALIALQIALAGLNIHGALKARRAKKTSSRKARPAEATGPAGVADELTDRNVQTIIELEQAIKSSQGLGDRMAATVAAFCGSMTFVWIHLALFGGWMLFNTSSYFSEHPDPFPFTLMALVVGLEAIFLSSFILISQNQEKRLTERRSHLDLQINLLAEQENTRMLKMLRSVATKVGAEIEEDMDLSALEASMRPERVVDQIEKASEPAARPPRRKS